MQVRNIPTKKKVQNTSVLPNEPLRQQEIRREQQLQAKTEFKVCYSVRNIHFFFIKLESHNIWKNYLIRNSLKIDFKSEPKTTAFQMYLTSKIKKQ